MLCVEVKETTVRWAAEVKRAGPNKAAPACQIECSGGTSIGYGLGYAMLAVQIPSQRTEESMRRLLNILFAILIGLSFVAGSAAASPSSYRHRRHGRGYKD